MLELSLPSRLQSKAERIGRRIDQLQTPWPTPILLSASAVSIYDCFPYLFEEAFPLVDDDDLDTFAVAARLYASSIFLHDKVFDPGAIREAHSDLAPVNGMRIMAMQWEAYRLLHSLFPSDCAFWGQFHCYVRQFTAACLEEQRFAAGRPWGELSEELALEIARGKNGIARTTIAGLAKMQGSIGALAPLTEAIDCYNEARQLWDDLTDWKEDLDAGVPSLLLAHILGKRPEGLHEQDLAILKAEIGREIYYGGHAAYVLHLALSALERADGLLTPWPKLAWRKIHEDLRRECRLLLSDIEQIVAENIVRSETQPRFDLQLPLPASDCQRLAWPALEFLVQQWRQGFGEARHVMHFPPEVGFGGPPYQRGDVFQRALIADSLCDSAERWSLDLRPVIEPEIAYLLGRRASERCGWRYFPELPELPPDADDLAQIIQVLWRSGRRHEIREFCSGPLSLLFRDNSHPDGSFETWIIPRDLPTPEEARQAEFARNTWGVGPDPDVMANLLYALVLADGEDYAGRIARGVAWLQGRQTPEGYWNSTWYQGPYYGTYVCTRLLSRTIPTAENIDRAATFLRTTQYVDGSWGSPLDTAFALLALAYVAAGDTDRASKALASLRATVEPDGSWPAHDFIRMDTGRATGAVAPILSYGSRTITTAFVVKAAALWDRALP
jgi:squalene-hopene/tetraprenyl-beta-curcumene cyclase